MMERLATASILCLLLAVPAGAKCEGPEHRQFDFWLGEWDVKNLGNGRTGAVNRLTSVYDGCVIREEYTAAGPYAGTSLNFYDQKTAKWHQTWIDNQGKPLFLSGGLEDGKMVLRSDPEVLPVQRITWTPNADGSVRQHWESSADGKTWTTVFDGLYTRRGEAGKNE